jgi:outer membrane lipoprotein LolB
MRFSGCFKRVALTAALAASVAGCSNWPGFRSESSSLLKLHQPPTVFRLDGRVSVKAGEESFSGGLQWQRDVDVDALMLRTPLGQGVAEMRGSSAGMELKNAEGRRFYATDADTLVRQALGVELPLRGLTWWVVGLPRPEAAHSATPDAAGHLVELQQDGWQILFSRYQSHNGYMLPGKLVARRGDDLEVRLVLDTWELP